MLCIQCSLCVRATHKLHRVPPLCFCPFAQLNIHVCKNVLGSIQLGCNEKILIVHRRSSTGGYLIFFIDKKRRMLRIRYILSENLRYHFDGISVQGTITMSGQFLSSTPTFCWTMNVEHRVYTVESTENFFPKKGLTIHITKCNMCQHLQVSQYFEIN